MTRQSIATAALAAVLLGVAPHAPPLLIYSAPAGTRPAGIDPAAAATDVLPSGRLASPAGKTTLVGSNPLGLALSPDGRFAIVSNAGSGGAGSSLAVVDTASMAVADRFSAPEATFFMGVATVVDPGNPAATLVLASDASGGSVRTFDLSAQGQLTAQSPIPLAAPPASRAHPAAIAVSPDGRTAYVTDVAHAKMFTLDLAARTVVGSTAVGNVPLGVAAAGDRVVASAQAPVSSADAETTISVLDPSTGPGADPATVTMDRGPDGSTTVGGVAPGAVVLRRDGRLGYVALANVDRVAVVDLASAEPRVVRGLDLRLYPDAPYGAAPSAEALSRDAKRLYVALAGLNAVAVLDARAPSRYRYGLIPTAWYPTALALSPNGRYLYVTGAKGVNGWGALTRVDLKHTSLVKATMQTLRYNRVAARATPNPIVPPLRSGQRSSSIERIVYVAIDPQSYDAVFGDLKDGSGLPLGNGDPSYVRYPESVTPNLHALARSYGVADNFYAADSNPALGQSFGLLGDASLSANTFAGSGVADSDPLPRAGSLFDAVDRAGLNARAYGAGVPVATAQRGPDESTQAIVADLQRYAGSGALPNFTYVRLRTPAGGIAATDRAIGAIVSALSHAPQWGSTVAFVVPDGSAGPDHVNPMRSFALVISPFARPGYVSHAHLYAPGILKTEEELLGLGPLSLNDLLATDLSAFFTDAPAAAPYAPASGSPVPSAERAAKGSRWSH